MLVQGSISALFAISLVRQDIAESQLMAPWWLKIFEMKYRTENNFLKPA
jgi:hypothetical protein